MKGSTVAMKKDLHKVHEYIYKKYVEPTSAGVEGLDDEQALAALEDHHSTSPLESNKEVYLYGILLFEMAFEQPERKFDYIARAKVILERYRQMSGDTEWDAVEDRLFDINKTLQEEGLLTKVEAAGDLLLDPAQSVATVVEVQRKFSAVPDEMVLVAEGGFKQGPAGEDKFLPAFLIDKYPVTNARYEDFLKQVGYRKPKYWDDARFNQPEQPVVGISLMDAIKFARWAGCELPTEEQYEKAARGTDGRTYPWGNAIEKDSADYGQDPESGAARPVGSFPKNLSFYGAYDLAGTVWEWTNTSHPAEENAKIIRGGSWCDPERYLKTYEKLFASVREKSDNLGFRLVKNHP